MKEINYRFPDEIIYHLRELHAPQEHHTELYCEGCSVGFEGEEPEWPCRTAEFIYSEHEQQEYLEAARWLRKWDRQMRYRNVEVSNRPWSFISTVFGRAADAFIADKVFPRVPFDRVEDVTYTFNKPLIQVSEQLLKDV